MAGAGSHSQPPGREQRDDLEVQDEARQADKPARALSGQPPTQVTRAGAGAQKVQDGPAPAHPSIRPATLLEFGAVQRPAAREVDGAPLARYSDNRLAPDPGQHTQPPAELIDAGGPTMASGDDALMAALTRAPANRKAAAPGVRGAVRAEPPKGGTHELSRGDLVGRFLVLSQLGAGGMGAVYLAHDPRLDRQIALKVMHPDFMAHQKSEQFRTRLMREARAMARLSHPNVVPIHDFGIDGDQIFLAMEFVKGDTLATWLEAEQPSHKRILEAFGQAARGLAAAHEAGLVHRDFKPDNVLIGSDGRVRILDFGISLAHDLGARAPVPETDTGSHKLLVELDTGKRLTNPRGIVGTPAYMAPEQIRSGQIDARTDQFAFCVALFEALHQEHPFRAEGQMQFLSRIMDCNRTPPSKGVKLPDWLTQLLDRGLARAPDARFESMTTLLEELEGAPVRKRNRFLAVGTLVTLCALGALGSLGWNARQKNLCQEGARHLEGVWGNAQAEEIRGALMASGLPYAARTAENLEKSLDRYAGEWNETYQRSCEATHVEGAQSLGTLGLSLTCLRQRMASFEALIEVLRHADTTVVQRSASAIASLQSPVSCGDADYLAARVRPPADPEKAKAVEQLRADLALPERQSDAGRYDEALGLLPPLVARAEALDYPPVAAETFALLGNLQKRTGAYAEAERTLERAFFAARHANHNAVVAATASDLVTVTGQMLARHDDGKRWGRHAMAAVEELDLDRRSAEAKLLNHLGVLYRHAGDHDKAIQHYERALGIQEAELGTGHALVARTLNNLGNAHYAAGDLQRALAYHQRTLELRTRTLSPDHPDVAFSVNNIASIYAAQKRDSQAELKYRKAIEIWTASIGERHPDLAHPLNNLGLVVERAGRHEEAEQLFLRALNIREQALGQEHPDLRPALSGLARVTRRQGKLRQAYAYQRRAVTLWVKSAPPDGKTQGKLQMELARLALASKQSDEAIGHYLRASKLFREHLSPDDSLLAEPLSHLGETLLARGSARQALPPLEEALELHLRLETSPLKLARTRLLLSRALSTARVQRKRARLLRRDAREVFASYDLPMPE